MILDLFGENKYEIDVQRTEYVHENDRNTKLTLDRVTYSDDTSFVVLSLTCDVETEHCNQSSIQNIYPCRSKMVEFFYHNKRD